MKLWLLIALVLTLQEGISVIAVLVHARELHYSLLGIVALWFAISVVEILLGYWFGKYIKKRFLGSKFELWVQKQATRLENSIDKNGERVALVLLGVFFPPALGAFIASWFDISFGSIFFFSFLGNGYWFLSTIAVVTGIEQILLKVKYGLAIVLIIAIIFVFASHFTKKKVI